MSDVSRRPRPRHAFFGVVFAIAAALALSVSPAAAKSRINHAAFLQCSSWQVAGASTFGALNRIAPAATTARSSGNLNREPADRAGIAGDTEFTNGGNDPQFAGPVPIPVYFHVITDGRTGNLSKSTVNDQIDVMNLGFSGFYGGTDTAFRFKLAGLDYTDNAAWFAQNTFADEVAMKSALKKGGSTDLNVYSTSGGGFLGWAYYPSIVKYQQFQVLDGIVFHYGSVPGGFIDRFNLGFTLVHEAGHWLGLAHTFEQGCQGHGDYVDDTPFQASPTSGCPIGRDSCPEPGLDPIHNFMDYSDDPCYTQFTAGQSDRTHEQYIHWRVQHGYK
jgi:hypothetical protein